MISTLSPTAFPFVVPVPRIDNYRPVHAFPAHPHGLMALMTLSSTIIRRKAPSHTPHLTLPPVIRTTRLLHNPNLLALPKTQIPLFLPHKIILCSHKLRLLTELTFLRRRRRRFLLARSRSRDRGCGRDGRRSRGDATKCPKSVSTRLGEVVALVAVGC